MSMLMYEFYPIVTSIPAVPPKEELAYHHVNYLNAATAYVGASCTGLLRSQEPIMYISSDRLSCIAQETLSQILMMFIIKQKDEHFWHGIVTQGF